jgi:regulatory protein
MDNLIVLKHGLKADMQIEEERLAQIQEENEFSTAFELALNYVAKYKKTKKQLIDYLIKKGYLYPVAIKVVKKLEGYGFVDDNDFAKSYAQQGAKNKGKMLIKMQLRAKGVDKSIAENAVEEMDEQPAANQLAVKYMRSKELTKENLAKCYSYLLSKGFSFESAQTAIKAIKEVDDDY